MLKKQIINIFFCVICILMLCSCHDRGEEFTLDQLAESYEADGLCDPADADQAGTDGSGTDAAGTDTDLADMDAADMDVAKDALPETDLAEAQKVYVHVCGAVKEPGVITLAAGSRVLDAVAAAGGFTEDAARDFVNLAAYVSDAEQIYIPTEEETKDLERSLDRTQTAGAVSESSALININTADAASLCTLPGIGESRAADIIAYREKSGGFQKIQQIMEVPGIKENTFRKLESRITVE